jgi:hypothetical protein
VACERESEHREGRSPHRGRQGLAALTISLERLSSWVRLDSLSSQIVRRKCKCAAASREGVRTEGPEGGRKGGSPHRGREGPAALTIWLERLSSWVRLDSLSSQIVRSKCKCAAASARREGGREGVRIEEGRKGGCPHRGREGVRIEEGRELVWRRKLGVESESA